MKNYAVSSTVSACGGEGAGLGGDAKAKPAPMKQEVSFVPVQAGMSKSDRTVIHPPPPYRAGIRYRQCTYT